MSNKVCYFGKGMLLGLAAGMVGGALACHWCHTHKRELRRHAHLTARKVGHLIENVQDIF